jgi:hypothetical protein
MRIVTQDIVKELFDYRDGELYWKTANHKTDTHTEVGSISSNGRKTVWVLKKSMLVHRIIFLYHHGYLPEFIDHKDGNPLNNKIENLREATRTENNQNCKTRKDSSTGIKGVYPHRQKYIAHLRINGKLTYLGVFDTVDEAAKTVQKARETHHKDFARHD